MQHLAGRTLARSALRCSRSSAASSSQPSASALAVAARRAASTTTGGPPHQPAAAPVTGAETTFDYNEDPQLAGLGFPKIKEVNRQERNPLGWWDNQERTNFGEPVSENDDVLSMWSPDALPTPPQYALRALLTMFATLGAFSGLVYMSLPDAPAVPRGFPYDGLVRELSGTDDEQFAVRKESENEIEDD